MRMYVCMCVCPLSIWMHFCHSTAKLLCHRTSSAYFETAFHNPLWSASFLNCWLNGRIERGVGGVKTIGCVSLIVKKEEKMWMYRYVWACTNTTVCLCAPERGRTGEVRGCTVAVCPLCAAWVLEEGRKWYPCLFPTCPTLTLLHPSQLWKEWGSPGNWTGQGRGGGQHGGPAFSHYEKERNQIQAKSLSIYCSPRLSRAANWKEIHRGNCTIGPGRTREERRSS